MIRLVLICLVLNMGLKAYADDSNSEKYFEILTRKTIEDFQKGIKKYNSEKEASAPSIKKRRALLYEFKVKNNEIRFSITSYLNNQMFINGKNTPVNTFGLLKKTTWMNIPFISNAVAEEGNPDAESTKVILTALGLLSEKLEDIGFTCYSNCVKERKNKNLEKILKTLDSQYEVCNAQASSQTKSMEVSKLNNMVSLLHTISDPEFKAVKKFFQKISETNKKEVESFMKDKLSVEKKYDDCIGVMTSGTMADMKMDNMAKGAAVQKSGGLVTANIEKAMAEAKDICLKIDQLKSCTLTVRKNVNAINTMKRESKQPTAVDYPNENLPKIDGIAR